MLIWLCVFHQIKGELKTAIKEKMNQQYGVNEDVTKSIDTLQQEVSSNNRNATSLSCKAGLFNTTHSTCRWTLKPGWRTVFHCGGETLSFCGKAGIRLSIDPLILFQWLWTIYWMRFLWYPEKSRSTRGCQWKLKGKADNLYWDLEYSGYHKN